NVLGRSGFEFSAMNGDLIVMKRPASGAEVIMEPVNTEAEARLRVTRLCEQGNKMRLDFFEARTDRLKEHPDEGLFGAEADEVKELRTGEINLKRALETFTRYVKAGKPFAVTSEEIQQSLTDSQRRLSYFARCLHLVKEERQIQKISESEFNQRFQ